MLRGVVQIRLQNLVRMGSQGRRGAGSLPGNLPLEGQAAHRAKGLAVGERAFQRRVLRPGMGKGFGQIIDRPEGHLRCREGSLKGFTILRAEGPVEDFIERVSVLNPGPVLRKARILSQLSLAQGLGEGGELSVRANSEYEMLSVLGRIERSVGHHVRVS